MSKLNGSHDEIVSKAQNRALTATPVMAQYLDTKATYPDCLIFFQMGDFYELFYEDAEIAAKALDIALTKRGQNNGDDIPMAGVPHHAHQAYLAKLIKHGFKVAICEQLEEPAAAKKRGSKAVVKRGVTRVVTAGTLSEEQLLEARSANWLAGISKIEKVKGEAHQCAIAYADISTGKCEYEECDLESLGGLLVRRRISEILICETDYDSLKPLLVVCDGTVTPMAKAKASSDRGKRLLEQVYEVKSIDGFGDFTDRVLSAFGLLFDYILMTQAGGPVQLNAPRQVTPSAFMRINASTFASLEIEASFDGQNTHSLIKSIDRTQTPLGARELHQRLMLPLMDIHSIEVRQDSVAYFVDSVSIKENVSAYLKRAGDIERAVSRIYFKRGGPRDLQTVAAAMKAGFEASGELLKKSDDLPQELKSACAYLNPHQEIETQTTTLGDFASDVMSALIDTPPVQLRDIGWVQEGFDETLDEFRRIKNDARAIILELQAKYGELTGIASLKIKHNNVLGYFVEVNARHGDALLTNADLDVFRHRQTLANSVRFTTEELNELEAKIIRADSGLAARELEIFDKFVAVLQEAKQNIADICEAIACIDVALSMAEWAAEMQCVRPEIFEDRRLDICEGRHPVIEAVLKREGTGFVSNDLQLNSAMGGGRRLMLLTGPNMAGKSTYLRQNALLIILAQAGAFVPAASMELGLVSEIFSRVGANDNLAQGQSTFMVEMIETAAILNQADDRAFVILDEVGRGTATFDGLAIAWAITEFLHDTIHARVIFATHYHELTQLVARLSDAFNANVCVKEHKGELVFLHRVEDGAATSSYGIQVARLAGLPRKALARARAILSKLEASPTVSTGEALDLFQMQAEEESAAEPLHEELAERLSVIDPQDMSPREALDLLFELKTLLEG